MTMMVRSDPAGPAPPAGGGGGVEWGGTVGGGIWLIVSPSPFELLRESRADSNYFAEAVRDGVSQERSVSQRELPRV
jgi:hypothetical protein